MALAGGSWGDEQIVSQACLAEATGRPSQSLNAAYGFLWWRNADGGWQNVATGEAGFGPYWPGAPEDAYAALGLGGQTVAVQPSSGVVLARLAPVSALGTTRAPVELLGLVADAVVDDG